MREMTIDDYLSFTAGLPNGSYQMMIDRVELELSRRLQPNMLIHFMVNAGKYKGVYVFKRQWLSQKRSCLFLFFTLTDFAQFPRKDHWDAAKLTEALAGKVMNCKVITKWWRKRQVTDIELPLYMDDERWKIIKGYEKEIGL